ncbi:MAG: C69 family dipeptidase [Synergistaceae bacterium]|nr:C69 family dipeptidase [Synergistaceae bacterium]
MCYLILAGKKATATGYVLGGHNDDLHGNTAATYNIVAGGKHEKGEKISLPRPWFTIGDVKIDEPRDLEIPQVPETYDCFMLQTFRGYIAGDTSAINKHQVAVVGGLNLAVDRNDRAEVADPIHKAGLAGGARYIALQRSRTARECVENLGALLSEYGAVFPSCVGIVDPNEAWYFEIGGGFTWAAVRVPDDCYMTQSNGYRIPEINPDDAENVICSPKLLDFAKEKGLWNPADGPFHWARAYGGKMTSDSEKGYYNVRRVWAVMNKFSPSMNLDPDKKEFPLFLKADKKIDVADVMQGLRDLFENTPFEAFPEAGGFGTERPVCVPSCIHSAVVETRGNIPADIGGVLWGCIGSPMTSPYVPHYLAQQNLLSAYTRGGLEYDRDSAFWRFRLLTNLVMSDYRTYAPIVKEAWSTLEKDIFAAKAAIEAEAIKFSQKAEEDGNAVGRLLTRFADSYDALAYEEAEKLSTKLQTQIAERQYLHFAKPGLEW